MMIHINGTHGRRGLYHAGQCCLELGRRCNHDHVAQHNLCATWRQMHNTGCRLLYGMSEEECSFMTSVGTDTNKQSTDTNKGFRNDVNNARIARK